MTHPGGREIAGAAERANWDVAWQFGGEPSGLHGFYRTCEERLLQVLRLWCGLGELTIGTDLDATVTVSLEVIDLPTLDPEDSVIPVGERDIVRGVRIALREIHAVPPDLVELRRVLLDDCLPWSDTVSSRQAIANGWVRDPRLLQPPGPFRRWQRDGTWMRILTGLQALADAARLNPAGSAGVGGVEPADHALGRSRGGWTTKLHLRR